MNQKIPSKPFTGPLFVVGMPRSGTKLLRDLLNRHPNIRIPEIETEFLPFLISNIENFKNLSKEKNFEYFHKKITRLPYFIYRRDAGQLVSAHAWHKACRKFDAAGIFEALIRLEVDAFLGSTVIWGDKSPSYLTELLLIKSVLPTARFIHIIRDVRDYCLSIHKAWGKNILRAAQRWADAVSAARRDGALLGADYMELHYEELVTETEDCLRRIANFVDVKFDPIMLTLGRPSENIGDARGAIRVVANNHGKYLNALSSDVLLRVESLAGETLTACGYSRLFPDQKNTRLSCWEMGVAKLIDGWHLIQYERHKWGYFGAFLFHFHQHISTRR